MPKLAIETPRPSVALAALLVVAGLASGAAMAQGKPENTGTPVSVTPELSDEEVDEFLQLLFGDDQDDSGGAASDGHSGDQAGELSDEELDEALEILFGD